MKKFFFPLETLYKIKKTLKDQLQAEYAAAEAALDKARRKKEQLQDILTAETKKYEDKVKKGMTVSNIRTYVSFFEELQNRIKVASEDVERAWKDVNRKRTELVEVFKEVKILEKLRERQYEEFKAEEKKEETNVLEDILSFSIAGRKKDGQYML